MAFAAVLNLSRERDMGWCFRYTHANGASLLFFLLFIHIGRGVYFGRYRHVLVWLVGLAMLFVYIGRAFLGYVLPWGQIRYWGATVITNLISAIPYVGSTVVVWVWGAYRVDSPTLSRFFSLHFLVPLAGRALIFLHIIFLHNTGRRSPIGVIRLPDRVYFHPYFTWKDIIGAIPALRALLGGVMWAPWLLGEVDNFKPADPLVTPPHIVPEWYFLFAYTVLRAIPRKLGGVLGLVAAVMVVAVPCMSTGRWSVSCASDPIRKNMTWQFFAAFYILTLLGGQPAEEPFITLGRISAGAYFSNIIQLAIPNLGWRSRVIR